MTISATIGDSKLSLATNQAGVFVYQLFTSLQSHFPNSQRSRYYVCTGLQLLLRKHCVAWGCVHQINGAVIPVLLSLTGWLSPRQKLDIFSPSCQLWLKFIQNRDGNVPANIQLFYALFTTVMVGESTIVTLSELMLVSEDEEPVLLFTLPLHAVIVLDELVQLIIREKTWVHTINEKSNHKKMRK